MDTVMAPAVRPERSERSERSDRGDRPERRERGARGGRDRDRGERRERPDRGGERGDRGDRGERGERGERPPRRYSPTSPEERFNVDEAFMANVREQAGWLMMGMDATVEVTGEADEVLVAINSDTDDALLTGRRGDTRMAIQTVLARLVNPKRGPGAHLIVDVNGYWQRRRDSLLERARELAERAVAGGEEMTTEPMSSEERRIVHRALAEDGRVTTESYGEGALKRIAIRAVEASDAEA
jgi:spoIIIJ-associated protein